MVSALMFCQEIVFVEFSGIERQKNVNRALTQVEKLISGGDWQFWKLSGILKAVWIDSIHISVIGILLAIRKDRLLQLIFNTPARHPRLIISTALLYSEQPVTSLVFQTKSTFLIGRSQRKHNNKLTPSETVNIQAAPAAGKFPRQVTHTRTRPRENVRHGETRC